MDASVFLSFDNGWSISIFDLSRPHHPMFDYEYEYFVSDGVKPD